MKEIPTEKAIKRIVGYVRVSTEEQASEGLSLDHQEGRIRAYAESQGWELLKIYREEGFSGKTKDRPELKNMIKDIEAGEIDCVLVYKVDRLTRRQKDLWEMLEDVFEPQGVGFKSVVEPFDTTTAQGKAFLGMLGVFAQLERDTISERTKDALTEKKNKREWVGRPPLGFRLNGQGLIEDPETMDRIKKAKRYHRQGLSYRAISDRLSLSLGKVYEAINTDMRTVKAKYEGYLS